MTRHGFIVAICALLSFSACNGPAGNPDSRYIELRQTKASSETLARFYLGGIPEPPADPLTSGLLVKDGGSLLLDLEALTREDSTIVDGLHPHLSNGRLSWDDFESYMARRYYADRAIPASLADLISNGWSDTSFFEMSVDGVMTNARRHISIPEPDLKKALLDYRLNGNQVIYDPGTLIVAEHRANETILEYTAMLKRVDGFWDFSVYDSLGQRIDSTVTGPKTLAAPTQCTGCHFGSRAFEPEKSFPGDAPAGPEGPRQILLQDSRPSARLVAYLNEHLKRSDYVLGLYGTLYLQKNVVDAEAPDTALASIFMDGLSSE